VLLQCHDLRKTYTARRGKIAAVDGIDLEARPGEFLAVCGRSGSGKSTLLGMVGGLCRPSGGTVRLDGVDLWSLRPAARTAFRARRVGFLFQFAGLLPSLRAVDNIALPAVLAGAGYEKAYARARDLLSQVSLADRWDAYPGELSGGQQRRVALARALVNKPVVLLADEPTNDLDEQSEREVLGLLHDLRRRHNTTLIVVTHDPHLAGQAERVIHLRGGRIVPVAAPQAAALAWSAPPVPVEPEPAPAPALAALEPQPLGSGLGRFLVGFTGWAALIVCLLWGIDYATARWQRHTIEEKQAERKKSQEMALQQLRAELEDVTYRPDGGYEVGIALQNFDRQKPLYILGPAVRVFVQANRNWQEVTAGAVGDAGQVVRAVTDKQVFRAAFRGDLDHYDELMKGYFHVRITNVMVVAASAEPGEDLFERTDDYYVYLKPQQVSEDEVRRRNGWKEGALVPRWMGMPAH
jgi:putative ABC transport system ATP-binding protein/macrolide transport system ATP-binding/permease protein/lipoprotein-releasing system ATP-binding protein